MDDDENEQNDKRKIENNTEIRTYYVFECWNFVLYFFFASFFTLVFLSLLLIMECMYKVDHLRHTYTAILGNTFYYS